MPSSENDKSLRAALDLRQYPWQDYVLPGDGRKAQAIAAQRRELANQLAIYANPDGTGITLGHKRIMRELGWTRTRLFDRLAELRLLGLVPDKAGLVSEHGTAVRRLDIASWRAGVRDSKAEVRDSSKAGVRDSRPKVRDLRDSSDQKSEIGDQKSALGTDSTGLPLKPPPPPPEQNGGGGGKFPKYWATIGKPSAKQRGELQAFEEQHGREMICRALDEIVKDDGFGDARNKWAVTLKHRLPEKLAKLAADREAGVRKMKDDSFQQASIDRQNHEIALRLGSAGPPVKHPTVQDLIDELGE